MSCYKHLSTEERESLYKNIIEGKTIEVIAKELNRSKSTISREIRRNGSRNTYSPSRAEKNYQQRRKLSVQKKKLIDPGLNEKVTELLKKTWPPEQISNRLRYEKSRYSISFATIYRAIKDGTLDKSLRNYLRIRRKKHHGKKKDTKCGHLNIDYTIHDRPKSVEGRKITGHFESDSIRGHKNSGSIGTHAERKTRFLVGHKMQNRTAKEYNDTALLKLATLPPQKIKSFTVDHGKEFSMHREFGQALNCKVYFADPSCPHQRGTNENTNGLLRQFFPKRTSFADISQDDVDAVVDLLNKRPRKCLGWKTPYEAFFNKVLHLT